MEDGHGEALGGWGGGGDGGEERVLVGEGEDVGEGNRAKELDGQGDGDGRVVGGGFEDLGESREEGREDGRDVGFWAEVREWTADDR